MDVAYPMVVGSRKTAALSGPSIRRPATGRSAGSVTLLLPNAVHQENAVASNRAYEFPPNHSAVRLQAQFLPGYEGSAAEERIKIIATKKKKDIIRLGFREGMFQVYDSRSTGMISDLVKRLNQLEPAEWAEATAVYKIEK